jgi:hypothetical protein
MLNVLTAMRLTSIKEIMISFEDIEESQVRALSLGARNPRNNFV